MDLEQLKQVIELMKDADLKVLEIKEKDFEIYLEDHSAPEVVAAPMSAPVEHSQPEVIDTEESKGTLVDVRSKQIGVFYTQPAEDSVETFVEVGDFIKSGDQIGLIETMKLFNEVLVDQTGIIEEILVKNGETVEYDQVLMRLRVKEG